MTNYTVLVKDKGAPGFRVIGNADANTPKGAVEIVLQKNTSTTEGDAVAVPTRSWNPTTFKLVTQPKLELG